MCLQLPLYTTYLANLGHLPTHVVPIAICGKRPDTYTGLAYPKLAPRYNFFQQYKNGEIGEREYTILYNSIVLDELIRTQVLCDLFELSMGRPFALWCYEKSSDFCHRHIVRKWFNLPNMVEFIKA